MVTPRDVVEGWAVETRDGLIFTVKGLVHPPDRAIAYLRYAPDPAGDRTRAEAPDDQRRYRRLYALDDQLRALERTHPGYVVSDPVLGLDVQSVPWEDISRVHDPRARLRRLLDAWPTREEERAAHDLARAIIRESGAPAGSVGLSGSLLFGLGRPGSDVDLVVYGAAACRAVHGALRRLLDLPGSAFGPLPVTEVRRLHALHAADTPLGFDQFARQQARKVNEGVHRGHPYFVRFVRLPEEVGERYGDRRYVSGPSAVISARVTSDAEALFTPNRYPVDDVRSTGGAATRDLREIVSFRGRFAEQARTGEEVRARGTVERVIPREGDGWSRLVVGGPGDYLLAAGLSGPGLG